MPGILKCGQWHENHTLDCAYVHEKASLEGQDVGEAGRAIRGFWQRK